MSKNPLILIAASAALMSFGASAATDTEVMSALIKARVTTAQEVVDASADYEKKFDEVTTALRIGKSESDRQLNALIKLKAIKTEVETDAAKKDEGIFSVVAQATNGDKIIASYNAEMQRTYQTVKSILLNSKSADRFTIANNEIVRAKKRFSVVRANIQQKFLKK